MISQRKIKLNYLLPKTATGISNGGLYHQPVKCGKRNCRCATGELHQGYYYFIRRVNGRLRKTYVPKRYLKQLSLIIKDARTVKQVSRRANRGCRKLLTDFNILLREYDAVIAGLVEELTCTPRITPGGKQESIKMRKGDSCDEESTYGRADRWYFAWA